MIIRIIRCFGWRGAKFDNSRNRVSPNEWRCVIAHRSDLHSSHSDRRKFKCKHRLNYNLLIKHNDRQLVMVVVVAGGSFNNKERAVTSVAVNWGRGSRREEEEMVVGYWSGVDRPDQLFHPAVRDFLFIYTYVHVCTTNLIFHLFRSPGCCAIVVVVVTVENLHQIKHEIYIQITFGNLNMMGVCVCSCVQHSKSECTD